MVHIDNMSTESVEAWLKRRKEEEKQQEECWEFLDLDAPDLGWQKGGGSPHALDYTWKKQFTGQETTQCVISSIGDFVWRKKK